MLQAFGDAYGAFQDPHLTWEVRTARIDKLKETIESIFGDRLYSPIAMKQGHVAGVPRDHLLVWAHNADARASIANISTAVPGVLHEHALGTDDLEQMFGMLVMRCGYKPVYRIAMGAFRTISEYVEMKQDPETLISFPVSSKKNYSHYQLQARRDMAWRDGQAVGDTPSAEGCRAEMFKVKEAAAMRKTRNRALNGTNAARTVNKNAGQGADHRAR